jgi:hypothetical protein
MCGNCGHCNLSFTVCVIAETCGKIRFEISSAIQRYRGNRKTEIAVQAKQMKIELVIVGTVDAQVNAQRNT